MLTISLTLFAGKNTMYIHYKTKLLWAYILLNIRKKQLIPNLMPEVPVLIYSYAAFSISVYQL